MEQPSFSRRLWNKIFNINHASYSGLTEEVDNDKIQVQLNDSASKQADTTPLKQAFYPNLWFLITVILLLVTIGRQPRHEGCQGDADLIWTPNDPGQFPDRFF